MSYTGREQTMGFKCIKEAEAIEGYGARAAGVGDCDILTLSHYVLPLSYSNVQYSSENITLTIKFYVG